MTTHKSYLLERLDKKVLANVNGIKDRRNTRIYYDDLPDKNFYTVNNTELVNSTIYSFLEINKCDHHRISMANYKTPYDRYLVRNYYDGYGNELCIDVHPYNNSNYTLICVVNKRDEKIYSDIFFSKLYNFFNKKELLRDRYGDIYKETKIVPIIDKDLPIEDKNKMKDLFCILSMGSKKEIKELLSSLYMSSINDNNAKLLFDYDILNALLPLLKVQDDLLLVPTLMVLLNIINNVDKLTFSDDFPRLLCCIKQTLEGIMKLYNETNSVYYRNTSLYTGSILYHWS